MGEGRYLWLTLNPILVLSPVSISAPSPLVTLVEATENVVKGEKGRNLKTGKSLGIHSPIRWNLAQDGGLSN